MELNVHLSFNIELSLMMGDLKFCLAKITFQMFILIYNCQCQKFKIVVLNCKNV